MTVDIKEINDYIKYSKKRIDILDEALRNERAFLEELTEQKKFDKKAEKDK